LAVRGHELPVRDPHPISETVSTNTNGETIMNDTRLPLPLELTKPVLLAGDLDTQSVQVSNSTIRGHKSAMVAAAEKAPATSTAQCNAAFSTAML